MATFKTLSLFTLTAIAEIVGCYLPFLWLRKGGSAWLLIPAAVSFTIFSWFLSLHPVPSGRVYAAYGGVYIAVAMLWLRTIDRIPLTRWDWLGASVSLMGMGIIVWGGWKGH